jgi:hypothetical protein
MPRFRPSLAAPAAVAIAACAAPAAAQERSLWERVRPADSVLAVGSEAEDRERLAQLLGERPSSGTLVRSLSSRLSFVAADTLVHGVIGPELFVVNNSALPFSQNDGALWAGRGTSWRLTAGVTASRGPWRVLFMPEIADSQNEGFRDAWPPDGYNRPINAPGRSDYASPWNQHPFPADVPVRFGITPYRQVTLGQSALWVEGRGLAAGFSAESQWWGPGLHDALVMTNNAAGVPHLFVRTARPLRTGIGDFEGRLMIGALAESNYFDSDDGNDTRSLSALAVAYRPRWSPDLTLGVARAVYAPTSGRGAALGHLLDVFGTFDRPNARPWSDSTLTGGRDQLASLFWRWVFPRNGTEIYGELGRAERPASVRDFLVDPNHTLAYIFGGQHARPLPRLGGTLRLQAEFAQLEQSPSYRRRPTHSWYTSRAAPQGYTQRGQVIGATIGPGSSHQWAAVDFVAPAWSAGLFVGRWRFNVDAMFAAVDYPPGTGSCEYDVTLYPGVRGSVRTRWLGAVRAEAIFGNRLNAFHQNTSGCPAPESGHWVDVRNRTLRVWLQPLAFR